MSNGTKLRIDGKMKKTGGGGYIKIGVDLFKKDGAKNGQYQQFAQSNNY